MGITELTDNFIQNHKKLKGKDLIIAFLKWKVGFYQAISKGIELETIQGCLNRVDKAVNEMAGLRE